MYIKMIILINTIVSQFDMNDDLKYVNDNDKRKTYVVENMKCYDYKALQTLHKTCLSHVMPVSCSISNA